LLSPLHTHTLSLAFFLPPSLPPPLLPSFPPFLPSSLLHSLPFYLPTFLTPSLSSSFPPSLLPPSHPPSLSLSTLYTHTQSIAVAFGMGWFVLKLASLFRLSHRLPSQFRNISRHLRYHIYIKRPISPDISKVKAFPHSCPFTSDTFSAIFIFRYHTYVWKDLHLRMARA